MTEAEWKARDAPLSIALIKLWEKAQDNGLTPEEQNMERAYKALSSALLVRFLMDSK